MTPSVDPTVVIIIICLFVSIYKIWITFCRFTQRLG